jgi:hypothetical protein
MAGAVVDPEELEDDRRDPKAVPLVIRVAGPPRSEGEDLAELPAGMSTRCTV